MSAEIMDINSSQQEIYAKLSQYENQIRQLQQQLQAIEESIVDLNSLSFGLDDIDKSFKEKDGEKTILAPMGRGIFIEAKLISDKITVDIGNKNFVKKSIPETKNIIKSQLDKLEGMKKDFDKKLEDINIELTKALEESQDHN